jgi:alpha-beta hydrolase superfamily lysophospholipase
LLRPRDFEIDGRSLVVLVHAAWIHADAWERWTQMFVRNGYDCVAVAWPGESPSVSECRARPELVGGVGLDDVLAETIDAIGESSRVPIVIGHGGGGLVAAALLTTGSAAAAIALAPTCPRLRVRLALTTSPRLLTSWFGRRRAVMPSKQQFHRHFANTLDRPEADLLHDRYVIPSSNRWLAHSCKAARSTRVVRAGRGPLLLVSGGRNVFAREDGASQLHRHYRHSQPSVVTDHQVFPDRGHSLVVDAGWMDIADYCLDWLTRQNL